MMTYLFIGSLLFIYCLLPALGHNFLMTMSVLLVAMSPAASTVLAVDKCRMMKAGSHCLML